MIDVPRQLCARDKSVQVHLAPVDGGAGIRLPGLFPRSFADVDVPAKAIHAAEVGCVDDSNEVLGQRDNAEGLFHLRARLFFFRVKQPACCKRLSMVFRVCGIP